MHSCLQIQEVLTIIFQHISVPGIPGTLSVWRKLGSSTLARLARTCKAFTEPALDNLWHYQTSLVPLILCLPQDAIRVEINRYNSPELRVTRELCHADYRRILYYGRRIRALSLCDSYHPWLPIPDPLIVPLLWSSRPDRSTPLLPMLNHLNLSLTKFDDLALHVRFAVGPRLRSVLIKFDWWEYYDVEHPWDNVAYVLKSAPGISSFIIEEKEDYPYDVGYEASPPLNQLYGNFNHLEYLDTRSICLTHGILTHLATVTPVKQLMFTILSDELLQFNSTPPPEIMFSCLIHMLIGTESLSDCTALLKRPGYRKLEKLDVMRLDHEDGDWELEPFFTSLRDYLPHRNLQSLHISGSQYYSSPPKQTVPRIMLGTLAPLFSFPNLTDVQITLDATVKLDNKGLGNIAKAWPRLRILRLFERTTMRRPKITLSGLLSLIVLCPELQELTLRMNALNIPGCAQLGDVCGYNLRSLDVCTSPVLYAASMVAFLTVTFPELSSLFHGWCYSTRMDGEVDMELTDNDESHLACWREVGDLLGPVTRDRARRQRNRGVAAN